MAGCRGLIITMVTILLITVIITTTATITQLIQLIISIIIMILIMMIIIVVVIIPPCHPLHSSKDAQVKVLGDEDRIRRRSEMANNANL